MQKFICRIAILCSLWLSVISCTKTNKQTDTTLDSDSLTNIKKRGKLRILTLYSSTSYFLYKGQPMGYEYELATRFAESLGVETEVIVASNAKELTQMLLSGKGDLVAYNMPITNELKDSVIYCGRQYMTHQVLVQRKAKNAKMLSDVTELIEKSVYVLRDSRYEERLRNLNAELGGGIKSLSIRKDSLTTEDLIEMVSNSKIDYTIADNDIALLNKTYYGNLDVHLKISFPQRLSWMVDKKNRKLSDCLNKWFTENVKKGGYKEISKRYFEQSKRPYDLIVPVITKNKISKYDPIFRKYAAGIEWDWKLVAAIAFVESKFNSEEISWSGARGLMQLMPRTANAMGVYGNTIFDPEANIKGAVKYIRILERLFSDVNNKSDKQKFILAAYNAGIGHVYDAQALAEKYGQNKNRWDKHTAIYISLMSNPEYYNDPVCKYGYLRGEEVCNYVNKVLHTYNYYKSKNLKDERKKPLPKSGRINRNRSRK